MECSVSIPTIPILVGRTAPCGRIIIPVSYTHLDVYKRQRKRYMSAENTTNTGAQEAENAEKYAVEVKNVTKIYRPVSYTHLCV